MGRLTGNLGIGFAVPSDLARRVMADLMKYGYVVRGYLGRELTGHSASRGSGATGRAS